MCFIESVNLIALTGMSSNTVSIYTYPGIEHVCTLPGDHTKTITGVIELRDKMQLVTCAMDRSIVIFNISRSMVNTAAIPQSAAKPQARTKSCFSCFRPKPQIDQNGAKEA